MRIMTGYPERLLTLEQLFLSEDETGERAVAHHVVGARLHQEYVLLQLEGIADRDQAERLRGLYVLVDIDHAVPLEEGEFYLYELIGLRVVTNSGEDLGTLTEVLETGANDVYVIDSPAHGQVLIPAIDSVVLKTDIDAKCITVRLPEGLLPG
jgi:16S rRNA processing protein RimM